MILESAPILPGQTAHEAGRALLARMYQTHTGKPLPNIAIAPRGKPYFTDNSVHFSISHTRSRVFCALSEVPVGIDAEEQNRNINLHLADKILSDFERAQFHRASDPRLALLTFWVLKEAAAKCTGEGLRGYPEKAHFSLDDPRVTIMDGHLVAVITQENAYVV